jgi:RNA polymerase sigma-70 factor (ECF subfamily)
MSDTEVELALWTDYHAKICTYLRGRVEYDQVEDMASDVFVRALVAISEGRGPTKHVGGWLYRIAHNLVIDHYRRRDRCLTVSLDSITGHTGAMCVHDIAEQVETQMEVRRAWSRLTSPQATAIEMQADGYELEEIAICLKRTTGAVKALQHRGRATLRARLRCVQGA